MTFVKQVTALYKGRLINLSHVVYIEKTDNGCARLCMDDGNTVIACEDFDVLEKELCSPAQEGGC